MQLHGIFDSHAHYDDRRFDRDRDEVIRSLSAAGVTAVMNIGADMESSRKSMELCGQYDFFHCAVGVHPHEAQNVPTDYTDQLRVWGKHPKVKAIGEIGLDYHYDFSPREKQRQVFEEQLILAKELALPVVIHSREAAQESLDMLYRYKPRGVVHCYSGSAEMAKDIVSLGMYVGFTGVVTFQNARRVLAAVAAVPLDRILVETDCPYMAPEPHRGKRCDSTMLPYIAAAIARVKGIETQELIDITRENTCKLFDIVNPLQNIGRF